MVVFGGLIERLAVALAGAGRAPDGGAVVVRGLGGAGKSTLAAELARALARDG